VTYYKLATKTINLVFTIGGSVSAGATAGVGFGGISGRGFLRGSVIHPLVSADWSHELIHFLPGGTTTTDRVLNVSCFGASNAYSDHLTTLNGDMGGSLTCDVVCDVCLSTDNPQTGTGDLAPFFNRVEDTPANTRVHLWLIPQPDQDVTATLTIGTKTISCTGNTGSNPAPLGYQTSLEMAGEAGGTISFITGGSPAASGSATGAITMGGWPTSSYAGKSCNTSVAHANTASETGSGYVEVTANASVSGPVADFDFVNGATAETIASREESGDRTAKLEGAVFHMIFDPTGSPGMYSGSLIADLTGFSVASVTFTGSFTDTVTQKQCVQSVSGDVAESIDEVFDSDTCSDSDSIDTYSPLAATIRSSSLVTNGDDPEATRLLIRGKSWGAMSFHQFTQTDIDNCSALTVSTGDYQGAWSISGSGSISAGSGHITFSGAGETVTRTFTPFRGYFANYRWLMLRIQADAASKDLTITINGKEWTVTTDATPSTWKYVYIDLCLPKNGVSDTDGTNTRWPEDADGYPTEGPYFGVGSTDQMTITGLESGVTYIIDGMSLNMGDQSARTNSINYGYTDTDLVSGLGYWWSEKPDSVVSESGTTTTFYTRRFFHSLPEECGQAVDEPAFKKQVTVGGFTGVTTVTYSHLSILSLINRLNHRRYPGMVATDLQAMPTPSGDVHPPATSEYFNSDLPAVYLGGGGLLAQNADSGNIDPNNWFRAQTGIDHVGGWVASAWVEGLVSMTGQPLYDSVGEWFSGCGDLFEHRNVGATDTGALLLRVATMIRGYGRGIVADNTYTPMAGETVDLIQSAVNRGTSTSYVDASGEGGEYITLLPFAQAVKASTLEHDTQSIGFTAYTKLRQRGVFVVIPPDLDERLCYYQTSDQRHYVYYISDGDLKVKRVYQTAYGELGSSPSVGSLKTSTIVVGNYSYPSAFELTGAFSNHALGKDRHAIGATHGVVVINKDTEEIELYRSREFGEDWDMETVGGTYSAVTATEHRTRVVVAGWRGDKWYCRVGKNKRYTGGSGSGEYTWSSEHEIVATTKKSGRLWVRSDGTIHFTYLDSSEVIKVLACSNLANDGTGTWD
jgi:hypothetical protein